MAKKRRNTPWFLIGLSLYALTLITAISLGLNYVSAVLAHYDVSTPDVASNAVFTEYFATDISRAAAYNTAEQSPYERDDAYLTAYRNMVAESGELMFFQSSQNNNEYIFTVAAGQTRVGTFTLREENGGYTLISVTVVPLSTLGVKITVYGGSTLYCNGVEVDKALATDKTYVHYSRDYIGTNEDGSYVVEPIYTESYLLTGFYFEPTLTVTDRRGRDAEISGEDGVFAAVFAYDDDRTDEIAERAISTMEEYSKYTQKLVSSTDLMVYFDTDSELFKSIKRADVHWNADVGKYKFYDESVSEVYFYDENTVSCRVSLKMDVVREGKSTVTTRTGDYRLFFHRPDRAWKLYVMNLDMGDDFIK